MAFNQIFPPSIDPINAGFMSVAENDIHMRVQRVYDAIVADWGSIIPSSTIVDEYLAAEGLDPWILSPQDFAILDQLEIVEG